MAKKRNQLGGKTAKQHPFRRAVLRGLGVVLPPLLTIVIFLWVWNTVRDYVLVPLENGTQRVIVLGLSGNILDEIPSGVPAGQRLTQPDGKIAFSHEGKQFVQLRNGQCVPLYVFEQVDAELGERTPTTGRAVYEQYVRKTYLNRYLVVPVFLAVFVLLLYLLGKFLAAGVGRFLWSFFERIIHQLPLVRSVYSSVKQVTDFIFSEREMEFTRVVAVEYPRQGIWSLGFVTGESMLDIRSAANEPVLSVLIPTSPMPATGYTITVRKSETIDLNVSVEQAFQFCVSCGVVVPPQQQSDNDESEVTRTIQQQVHGGPSTGEDSAIGSATENTNNP